MRCHPRQILFHRLRRQQEQEQGQGQEQEQWQALQHCSKASEFPTSALQKQVRVTTLRYRGDCTAIAPMASLPRE